MPGLFSFRNEVLEYDRRRQLGDPPTFELLDDTTLLNGHLDNLLTRPPTNGVILEPSPHGNIGTARILARTQPYEIDPTKSLRAARVIALTGLALFPPTSSFGVDDLVQIYGRRGGTLYPIFPSWIPMYRLESDGDIGLCNRVIVLPDSGTGQDYNEYVIHLRIKLPPPAVDQPGAVQLGGIWIGNAVVFDNGVDADWVWRAQDTSSLALSKGGQAYTRPVPVTRALRIQLSGGSLTDRLAFGRGVKENYVIEEPRYTSDWLSDAAMHLGSNGTCVLIPRANLDDPFIEDASLYGRLTQPIEIEHIAGGYYRSSIQMIEER